ncbi:MAG: glycosyltransferase family 4 protein, partial [Rubricoccaceae bacterium]
QQVTPACGVAVRASSPSQVVSDVGSALLRLAADGALRAAMSRAARARVRACYRWPLIVAERRQAQREVLGLERAPRCVLVNAFACEPGKGSEQSQGWQFVRDAARSSEVWVLTHEASRAALSAALREQPDLRIHPVYYALPFERARFRTGQQRRRGVGEQFHYYAWQWAAGRRMRRLHARVGFDLTHHVSYMRCWSPTAAAWVPAPLVWGPVGGGESAPRQFYAAFSREGRRYERLRDAARWLTRFDPFMRRTTRRAAVALATTEQSAALMTRLGARGVRVMPGVALGEDDLAQLVGIPAPPTGPFRMVAVGRLVHWKGFDYAIRGFAAALAAARAAGSPALDGATLDILGEGPERARLQALVASLGLEGRVRLRGRVPRPVVLAALAESHVLVHPSFHDSGGYATLEAMAAGRAVVCLALGGPAQQVTPACGVAVRASSPSQVVSDVGSALLRLAADGALRAAMGRAARARVLEAFTADHVMGRTLAFYDALHPIAPSEVAAWEEAGPPPAGDGCASAPATMPG